MADLYPDPTTFSQQPFGAPQQQYNPLGSGNQTLDMLFAQYATNYANGGFLPQQFPAEHMLQQMLSAKYNTVGKRNENAARQTDQQSVLAMMRGIRARGDNTPLSNLSESHLNNFAGMMTNPFGQMLSDMLIGPQNTEDLFYGRRGSKVRLAGSVNRIGFYRPDSVAGGDRMREESLTEFTDSIYNNLYGPNADLNDISGFSAGRSGLMMEELARRGMLPASIAKLSASDQTAAMRQYHKRGESPQIDSAVDAGKSIDEIAQLQGGESAVRKVDATRVANSLKEYTKSLSVIREIFGANGITNAPMPQLIAALDAITQNSSASMSPGKIENLVRRTQLAARDSGVSLESLMGLTARAGALTDKYGLSREAAPEHVVAAMEHVQSMREFGDFKPGFGRIDLEKSGLFSLEQNARADSSKVGRMLGVANRIVTENTGADGKIAPAFEAKAGNLLKMVNALKRGDATYYDHEQGREINIYEEMGSDPDKFFKSLFEQAGVDAQQSTSYLIDPNTQEFAIRRQTQFAQAAEIKQKIANRFAGNSDIGNRISDTVTGEERNKLGGAISRNYAGALIDGTDSTMSISDRLNVLRGSMRQSVQDHLRRTKSGLTGDALEKETDRLFVGKDSILGFENEEQVKAFLGTQQANTGTMLKAEDGYDLGLAQQQLNSRLLAEKQRIAQRNIARAELFNNVPIGDGSNLLQRFSDYLGNPSAGISSIFNVIDSGAMRSKLYNAAGGEGAVENVYESMRGAYAEEMLDTTAEQDDLISGLNAVEDFGTAATRNAFGAIKEQFKGTAGESRLADKTDYISTDTLAKNLKTLGKHEKFKQILGKHIEGGPAAVDELFKTPDKAFKQLAAIPTLRAELGDLAGEAGLPSTVVTEAELRDMQEQGAYAFRQNANRSRVQAIGNLNQKLNAGNAAAKDILDVFGGGVVGTAREELTTALDASITDFGDTAKQTDFENLLEKSGLSTEAQKSIKDTAALTRATKQLGGLDTYSEAAKPEFIAKIAALKEQVGKADGINKDSELGKLLTSTDPAASKQLLDLANGKDGKTLDTLLDEDGKGGDGKQVESLEKRRATIDNRTKELLTQQQNAADPTGIVSAITSAIGPVVGTIGESIKTALSSDLKIENVTITNLKVEGILNSLMSAVTGALAGNATATGGTGGAEHVEQMTLRVIDMENAVLSVVRKGNPVATVAGAPPIVNPVG